MPDKFWESFNSVNEGTLKELPFFHSTGLGGFEDIVREKKLKAKRKDKFYDDEKIFFFYGNPLYYEKSWNRPIILGLKLNNVKDNVSISPMDTGLIHNLKSKSSILQFAARAKEENDFYRIHLTTSQTIELSTKMILSYIAKWFYYYESYKLVKPIALLSPEKDIEIEFHNILKTDFRSLFRSKYIEKNKNGLNFDKRKGCVELAVKNEVKLRDCNLLFAAVPDDSRAKSRKDFLADVFSIGNKNIADVIYEYPLQSHHEENDPNASIPYSLEDILERCQQEYYKRFKI